MLPRISISLSTADGRSINAYLVEPKTKPKGGVVILQEIFGVTDHMKALAGHFAEQGYRAVVPALFDQVSPNAVVSYQDAEQGRALAAKCDPEKVLMDIQAAADRAKVGDRVSVVGYCWGGTYAYLSACELDITSAVAYYGTRIIEQLDKNANSPVLFHFGGKDPIIKPEYVAEIQAANPDQQVLVYPEAGHAFSNADRPNYHPESAELAWQRTLEFLAQ
jgi:carboxymethylenebutenolidase